MSAVYLDHNATTPLAAAARNAMLPWLGNPANASSVHRYGHSAREAVEHARRQIAVAFGAQPEEVVFTSGGTESNDLALRGLLHARPGAIVTSAVEHAAVREAVVRLGRPVKVIPVSPEGVVDLPALARFLDEGDTALVSVMWANNETGVVHDLAGVAARCAAAGIPLHTDAVQAVGKLQVDFRSSGAGLMSVSAHKFNGPQGVGALLLDRALPLQGVHVGGGQERGLRAGTEPVAAIVGFGAAAEAMHSERAGRAAQAAALRDRLEAGLAQLPVQIVGAGAARLPNTTLFTVAGVEGEALLLALDEAGFAVSSGSACASGRREPSHVLIAMGVPNPGGAVRVSVGVGNQAAEIDTFLDALERLLRPGSLLVGGGAAGGW